MKKIQLRGKRGIGNFTLVDDEDFDLINKYTWAVTDGYARAAETGKPHDIRRTFYLHRLLMNPPKNMKVDHINGDRLDNRKKNLRICTVLENNMNRKKQKGSSIYKGVHWRKTHHKWEAMIFDRYIGLFDKELHAAMAYDMWAKELFGEFANLNFKSVGIKSKAS